MNENSTEIVLSEETKKYVQLFYEPKISAYSFFKLFFAVLYEEKVVEVTRDFTDFLFEMKRTVKFNDILREVKFRNNGVYVYSNQIEDSIFNLQNVGLLGKKNPSFGKIIIEYTDDVVNEALQSYEQDDIQLVREMVGIMKEQGKWGLKWNE